VSALNVFCVSAPVAIDYPPGVAFARMTKFDYHHSSVVLRLNGVSYDVRYQLTEEEAKKRNRQRAGQYAVGDWSVIFTSSSLAWDCAMNQAYERGAWLTIEGKETTRCPQPVLASTVGGLRDALNVLYRDWSAAKSRAHYADAEKLAEEYRQTINLAQPAISTT
jgi:hypothetical protein